jgi:hypothetical protein
VTAQTTPSCRAKSKIATMFGCESEATASASRSKRERASASSATVSGSTLIATSRWSLPSRAR